MPKLFNASNNAGTILTAAIDHTATSVPVEDTSKFPEVPFLITINDEIMEVTGKISNSFTVIRGIESTTATAHEIITNGMPTRVENRFTAGTYGNISAGISFVNGSLNSHKADGVSDDVHNLISDGKVIQEVGLNDNGRYVMFSDGTLICHIRIATITDITPLTATEGGLNTFRGGYVWVYPATFIFRPTVSFHGLALNFGSVRRFTTNRIVTTTATSAEGQITALETFNTIENANFIAIGRWK